MKNAHLDSNGYLSISFVGWHGGENGYDRFIDGKGATVYEVWTHDLRYDMDEAGISEADQVKLYNVRKAGHNRGDILPDWEGMVAAGGDVYVLWGKPENLREAVGSFIVRVMQRAWAVSGDDDYYDYYPDHFTVLDQIVPHLDLQEELDEARMFALAVRYAPAEGEVFWEDVLDTGLDAEGARDALKGAVPHLSFGIQTSKEIREEGGYYAYYGEEGKRQAMRERINHEWMMRTNREDLVPFPEEGRML